MVSRIQFIIIDGKYFSDTELVVIGGQTSNGGPILVKLPNVEMYEEGVGWYEITEIYPPR